MERKNGLQQSTIGRQERFRGTGRTMPLMDSSFRVKLRGFKLPSNFPGLDSTEVEVRDYLFDSGNYPHKGYRARIPVSPNGLNHNSHH